ncbi:unnamed protein product [Blepharisma stoltei]|uniref:Uncharacterized protein n=1 Tax=Blepharisma stoltei TaxID=1481888 RepID=A0AAU9K7K7_9CILI|nr:unnamed protein product [Blepharisma stoltei]
MIINIYEIHPQKKTLKWNSPAKPSKSLQELLLRLRYLSKSPIILRHMLDPSSPRVIASVEISLKISNNFWTFAWYKRVPSIEKLRMASRFIHKIYMYHILFMYLLYH